MKQGQCEIVPFDGPLGAEVRGVDLRFAQSGSILYIILAAFRQYSVLLFREQQLSDERLAEVSEWFGPQYIPPPGLPVAGGSDQPRVVKIANRDGGVGAVGPLPPHSDLQYMPVPPSATMLYALQVPDSGGDTGFANLQWAYEELSPALRERLTQLQGVVLNPFVEAGYGRSLSGVHQHYSAGKVAEFAHPVVRTHPDTGRRSLYFSPFVEKLLGDVGTHEESELLQQLAQHIDQPHLYHMHQWDAGDLLLWDNRCTNHKREAFDTDQPRVMHRLEIAGTRPF